MCDFEQLNNSCVLYVQPLPLYKHCVCVCVCIYVYHRWLLDSAERRGVVNLTTLPLGLIDGMKHSVSREDLLNSLSFSLNQTPTHSETQHKGGATQKRRGWRLGKGRSQERKTSLEMCELQPKREVETETLAVGVGKSQSEEMKTYKISEVGNEGVGSRTSLVSSTATEREGQFSRADSFRSSSVFQV